MQKILIIVLALFTGCQFSFAQDISENDPFQLAREQAFSDDYDAAIATLIKLKEAEPKNMDYSLFLARVYSWKKEYPEAIFILKPLLQVEPISQEVLKVMVTTQLWAENYKEALVYSDQGIKNFSNSFFRIQKAKSLHYLNRSGEALKVLQVVLEEDENNPKALALQTEIFQNNRNQIIASYTNTSFSSPPLKSWNSVWIGYKTHVGKIPVIGKYHFGSVYDKTGSQVELEVYPKIGDSGYLYLNAGTALNDDVFPPFRAGAEYFHSLNSKFEVSLGSKLLIFENSNAYLFTGQVAYTFPHNLKLTYRPYLSLFDENWSLTNTLSFRISNPLRESFWVLNLQYGTIPYEYYTSTALTNLDTFRIGVQYQFRVSKNVSLQPIFMYEYEEFLPSEFRNRFNSQLISIFRF